MYSTSHVVHVACLVVAGPLHTPFCKPLMLLAMLLAALEASLHVAQYFKEVNSALQSSARAMNEMHVRAAWSCLEDAADADITHVAFAD